MKKVLLVAGLVILVVCGSVLIGLWQGNVLEFNQKSTKKGQNPELGLHSVAYWEQAWFPGETFNRTLEAYELWQDRYK